VAVRAPSRQQAHTQEAAVMKIKSKLKAGPEVDVNNNN
jgi:hypothetical protein